MLTCGTHMSAAVIRAASVCHTSLSSSPQHHATLSHHRCSAMPPFRYRCCLAPSATAMEVSLWRGSRPAEDGEAGGGLRVAWHVEESRPAVGTSGAAGSSTSGGRYGRLRGAALVESDEKLREAGISTARKKRLPANFGEALPG
jgi:hypothetical protein